MKIICSTLIMLSVMMAMYSCKKGSDGTSFKGKVKSVYNQSTGKTKWYSYDSLGRILFITEDGDTTKYTYAPGMVSVTSPTDTTTFNLNASGNAVSSSKGGTFAYGADGYMISYTAFSVTTSNVYTEGNITSYIRSGTTGVITYYPFDENRNDRIGESKLFPEGSFFGKRSKNLVKLDNYGSGTATANHSYAFDNSGRVLRDTGVYYNAVFGNSTTISTYTYY